MKLFARIAALAAVSAFSLGVAAADTINSSSATVSYTGFSSTIGTLTNNAPVSTFNLGTGGGVWAGPIGASNYVSYNANTAPGGTVTAPTGTYTYVTSFTGTTTLAGSITVLADDTTSVYLNGVLVTPAAPPVPAAKCTMGTPNCVTMATYSLNGIVLGTNTLTFGTNQLFGAATGLDFSANVNALPTPEPGSLLLLGTGLVGSAGMFFRRLRA